MQTKDPKRVAMCKTLEAMQKDGGDVIICKDNVEIKAPNADGTISVIASTEDRDRDGDVIMAGGWDLKDFKKNPVIMWAHDYSQLPIGRAHNTRKEDGKLISDMEFTTHDVNPLGATVRRMFELKFLNAVSVGFKPAKFEPLDKDTQDLYAGIRFLKQSLLEYSAVPIPSNPNALANAKAAGIDMDPIKDWTERVLDGDSPAALWIPLDVIEQMRKAVNTNRVFGLHHVEPRDDVEQYAITAQHVSGEVRSVPLDPSTTAPPHEPLDDTRGIGVSITVTGDALQSDSLDAARAIAGVDGGIVGDTAEPAPDVAARVSSIGVFKIDDREYLVTQDESGDLVAKIKEPDEKPATEERAPFDFLDVVRQGATALAEEQRRSADPLHGYAKKLHAVFSGDVEPVTSGDAAKGEGQS